MISVHKKIMRSEKMLNMKIKNCLLEIFATEDPAFRRMGHRE